MTETLFSNARIVLPDEILEGTVVVRDGKIFEVVAGDVVDQMSDAEMMDSIDYTVFPNISFSMKPDGCIWLRATPYPGDPQKCYFDMWYLTLFPEGSKEYWSNSMRDWVSVDHQVEHETGIAGEVSCGPGIDQDVAIWNTQQQGLRSRGFRGEYMPWQERRITFFHCSTTLARARMTCRVTSRQWPNTPNGFPTESFPSIR